MKNNNLYALGLTAVMTLGGCAKNEMLNKTETTPTANVSKQKKEYLEDGVYRGVVDGKPAEYKVYSGNCHLKLYIFTPENTWIDDYSCNNTADLVHDFFTRSSLEYGGQTEKYDALLRQGRELVKPKNKIR